MLKRINRKQKLLVKVCLVMVIPFFTIYAFPENYKLVTSSMKDFNLSLAFEPDNSTYKKLFSNFTLSGSKNPNFSFGDNQQKFFEKKISLDLEIKGLGLRPLYLYQEEQKQDQKLVIEEQAERLAKLEALKQNINKENSKKTGLFIGGAAAGGLSGFLFYKFLMDEGTEDEYGEFKMSSAQKTYGILSLVSFVGAYLLFASGLKVNKKLKPLKLQRIKLEQEYKILAPIPDEKQFDIDAKVEEKPEMTEEEKRELDVKKKELSIQRRIQVAQEQIKEIKSHQAIFYSTAAISGLVGGLCFYKTCKDLLDMEAEFKKSTLVLSLVLLPASYLLFKTGSELNQKIIKNRKEIREIERERYKKILSINLLPIGNGLCLNINYIF